MRQGKESALVIKIKKIVIDPVNKTLDIDGNKIIVSGWIAVENLSSHRYVPVIKIEYDGVDRYGAFLRAVRDRRKLQKLRDAGYDLNVTIMDITKFERRTVLPTHTPYISLAVNAEEIFLHYLKPKPQPQTSQSCA